MSMISTVNEAINRKLASISFTDIIIGTVISLEPLQIRINNRIVIGLSFIEPMSLGIDDNSPGSALPLTVGEKIQMIRYSNGQRFYVLGKSSGKATSDYKELENLPKLDTISSTSLSTSSSEEIIDVIKLHKVAKTGSYNDLLNKPKLNTANSGSLAVNKSEELKGIILLHKVAKTGNFNDLQNKPKLNTANSTSLTVNESEELKGTISLHKVAKTGSYNDLLNKPAPVDLSNYVTLNGAQTISGKKTFSTLPESSKTPTTANQLVNKNYVDTNFLHFEVIEEF